MSEWQPRSSGESSRACCLNCLEPSRGGQRRQRWAMRWSGNPVWLANRRNVIADSCDWQYTNGESGGFELNETSWSAFGRPAGWIGAVTWFRGKFRAGPFVARTLGYGRDIRTHRVEVGLRKSLARENAMGRAAVESYSADHRVSVRPPAFALTARKSPLRSAPDGAVLVGGVRLRVPIGTLEAPSQKNVRFFRCRLSGIGFGPPEGCQIGAVRLLDDRRAGGDWRRKLSPASRFWRSEALQAPPWKLVVPRLQIGVKHCRRPNGRSGVVGIGLHLHFLPPPRENGNDDTRLTCR